MKMMSFSTVVIAVMAVSMCVSAASTKPLLISLELKTENNNRNLSVCTDPAGYLDDVGNCSYPPRRNNRMRMSCRVDVQMNIEDTYCYKSTEPYAKSVYCDGKNSCRCYFDETLPPTHRYFHIYRQIRHDDYSFYYHVSN